LARKPGTLKQLQIRLWRCILDAEELRQTTRDEQIVLRAIHAMSQAASVYLRSLEQGDLEKRIMALEEQIERRVA